MKKFYRMITAALALTLLLSLSGCGAGDGKTHLVFQIWDVYQRPGMQAMCDVYTVQHPDVTIEVQVTSWNEYWTKLEAAAESNAMGSDGRLYGVPKDKDNGLLVYIVTTVEKQ